MKVVSFSLHSKALRCLSNLLHLTAAAVVPTSSGLTTDELALVKCLNQKEAIEYEAQLKKLITKAIKCFQWGQDPEDNLTLDLVNLTLVHDVKALIKMMNDDVARVNQREIVNTVTNADGQCIWDPDIMEDDNDDDKAEEVQIQEQGVPVPPDWVEMVQNLDVTLDAHQVDKIVMLLQCHSEMLECQAMVSKMLAELGKSVDPVTFRLILQTVIWPIHHINIPDSHMPAPKKTKKAKLMREEKMVHCITPNPNLMKNWVDDSATLYLATTLYYWFKKIITKSSNMKQVVGQF